tara:strand:- start:144 stop:584 length:441 start_codon:yes stop_codon:yes gene_type:complete
MLKYLLFIIIGIILYLYNRKDGFSIGAIWRIPLGLVPILQVDNIDLTRAEAVDTTPLLEEGNFRYAPINQIYNVDDNYYYYTDTNMNDMLTGPIDENFINTINNQIRIIQNQESDRDRERQEILQMRENRRRGISRFACSTVNDNV